MSISSRSSVSSNSSTTSQERLRSLIRASRSTLDGLELQLQGNSLRTSRGSTFSQIYSTAAAADLDRDEGVWSDFGVLHIQNILLRSLASQENAHKGLNTRNDELVGYQARGSSWRRASQRSSRGGSSRSSSSNGFEMARQDTVEMLGMLHSEPDVLRNRG